MGIGGVTMTTTQMTTLLAAVMLGLVAAAPPASAQMAAPAPMPQRQWMGEFVLGGAYANGNTERRQLDIDGKVSYRAGRVQDTYKAAVEIADNGAITIARRWMVGAHSSIDIMEGLYGFGFANYEDDRFSGYNYELDGGLGAGYRIVRTDTILLSVEAGPGYRYSKVRAPAGAQKKLFARGVINFEWLISDAAKIENLFSVNWDSDRSKIENTFAVTSKLTRSFSGRFSINVRRNSDPPAVTLNKTDTLAKVGIVYSF
jgi:putative salt-induced outer membrane protein